MNLLLLIGGLLGVFTVIGHFTMGKKMYLDPMLASSMDLIPKKVMHCVFHYVSTFLILSALVLVLLGFGVSLYGESVSLAKFIALNYLVFAVWQIIIALTSGIPRGIAKLFQWTFFLLIAVFAWFGA